MKKLLFSFYVLVILVEVQAQRVELIYIPKVQVLLVVQVQILVCSVRSSILVPRENTTELN